MTKPFTLAVLAMAVAAASVAGCGVRGSLKAPAQAEAGGSATSAEGGEATRDEAAVKPKPHRGFILDGLLR